MSMHSVASAKNTLSALIERALGGENIVITRHGQPVVELRPVQRHSEPVSSEGLEWLKAHRVPTRGGADDSGVLLSSMRDEGER